MIYLDNAATTKIDPEVLKKMFPYLTEYYGNSESLYGLGRDAANAVDEARKNVAEYLGTSENHIIFTSGASESNNLIFEGLVKSVGNPAIIISSIEHESVIGSAQASFNNIYVAKPTCREGIVTFDSVKDEIDRCRDDGNNVVLVSVMHTNNETGVKNDVEQIGEYCENEGILFHSDCTQAAGSCPLNVDKLHCDFLSFSGHKIHAPKGTGVLYVRNFDTIKPIIHGGDHQEFGYRGGTENVAGIVGLGEACKLLTEHGKEYSAKIASLRDEFYDSLMKSAESLCISHIIHINGDIKHNGGKTINLRFDGIDGETLAIMLDSVGVEVSTGSACRSHVSTPSYVLTSMGITDDDARNSIRVSFSRMNTFKEVKEAANIIARCASALYNNQKK